MTENEAIQVFKELLDVPCEMLVKYDSVTTEEQKNALVKIRVAEDMAIQALEEIQQYRAIGTVKEIRIREAQFKRLSEGYLNDLTSLREYQSIGTVEELKTMKENGAFTGVELAQILAMQMELKKYQSIGTIEEFKALKEKSVGKKPIYSDFDENEAEEIIPYKALCPVCGHEFEFGTWNDEQNHHCNCGQKLDWSE